MRMALKRAPLGLALAGGGLLALGGPALANPSPWEINLQPAATPIMEMIHRFNNGAAHRHGADRAARAGAARLLRSCASTRRRTRSPRRTIAQHADRGGLDGRADPDPGRHRGAVLLAALRRARSGARHRRFRPGQGQAADHQGDRQPVVLDLRVSRQRRRLVRFAAAARRRAANPAGEPRLLAVDNEMVVPVGTVVRMQVIGADVIHSFAVPAFGIKIDAVPGRLNETWFRVDREGIYYGQCSELCGRDHAFMPIAVRGGQPGEVRRLGQGSGRPISTAANKQLAAAAAKTPTRPQVAAALRTRADAADSGRDGSIRGDRHGDERRLSGASRSARARTIRRDGAAGSIRPTTRTSARCT